MKRLNKFTILTALSATAFGGAAYAGSLVDAPVEAPVYQPAPAPAPMAAAGDWTGFYTGLQLGYADVEGKDAGVGLDGNNGTYGFHAGYDYDFGQFVLGGELDYDKTDIDLAGGAANIDSVARIKLKGGYDLGNTLVYATAGAARADTSVGTETGPFVGVGMAYRVNDSYQIGAEVLQHRFSDIGGAAGVDADATTFNLRGSLRF